MKDLRTLEIHRQKHPRLGDSKGASTHGFFVIYGLRIIASTGAGWDHVSVSLPDRCPTWSEMKGVRELFFEADETVVQIFPPADRYINFHPYCLHLWRKQDFEMPLPPKELIA